MRSLQAGDVPVGLYAHIPFCVVKCHYCDFSSYAGKERLFSDYCMALEREVALHAGTKIRSAYIGGGTPTALQEERLCSLLLSIRGCFVAVPGLEFTVEANPGTVDEAFLQHLRRIGVNRLSLGVQSMDDGLLAILGRIHSARAVVDTVKAARRAGFYNINLDLLFGLPTQTLDQFDASLRRCLAMEPEHLSLYCLTLEEGTPLALAVNEGSLPMPDPDLAADMYDFAQETLRTAGYIHYEISNWARTPETECIHNLGYWQRVPYIGLGAGAHSFIDDHRFYNTRSVEDYIMQMARGSQTETATTPLAPGPAAVEIESINRPAAMAEMMFLGLRMAQGVAFSAFEEAFGVSMTVVYEDTIHDLTKAGLLETSADRVFLTPRGRALGNQVFMRFLPEP